MATSMPLGRVRCRSARNTFHCRARRPTARLDFSSWVSLQISWPFSWPFFFDPRGRPPYIEGMEQPSVAEIIENFELMEEGDARSRYLIELARALPPLPDAARNDANKVRGCASQVWLSTSV